ncbi:MAG TPA: trehalose-6-phosphate synthase [Solimonas sp.]|nr:trehalose-6-phosphate synthase [Solimonas sp.]
MSRLVVVSNRVAPLRGAASAGGLAVALSQALGAEPSLWFGWSGKTTPEGAEKPRFQHNRVMMQALLDLPEAEYDRYYNGFANRCLWPLFHFRSDLIHFDAEDFAAYRRVNERFAAALQPLLRPDDLIWAHDYHLFGLATALRALGVKNRMGLFLHIPFPPADLLETFPKVDWLLRSMFDYDVVGLQTKADLRRFGDGVRALAAGHTRARGFVAFGRELEAGAFPIGVDVDKVRLHATSPETRRECEPLRATLQERVQIVGVDRLDYSKGLVRRMSAYQTLLERYPDTHGKVELLQIAPLSRGELEAYKHFRVDTERAAVRINGRFARLDWTPVRYLNRPLPWQTLTGIYRMSRIGLITPTRDGMNLVAKEFVAAQDPDDPGVLVLSRFAGAAEQMEAALLVNPYDPGEVAAALERARLMDIGERRQRHADLLAGLKAYDLHRWHDEFVRALKGPTVEAAPAAESGPVELASELSG